VASSSAAAALGPEAAQRSFESLEGRVAVRRQKVRGLRAGATLAALCLAAGGAYWGSTRGRDTTDESLTYRVDNGPKLHEGELVSTSEGAGPTDVTFSDGTRIHMDARARGRVADLDPRGGRVTLYQGRAHVDVRHRQDTRWLFQAGPFEVRVHGTAFSLSWDALSERFDLKMESGVVSVVGPVSEGEVLVRAGETLSLGLRDTGERGNNAKAPSTSGEPSATQAAEPPSTSGAAARRTAMPTGDRLPTPARSWQAELAAGHAAVVVTDAERRGIPRVLASANGEDLAALADAARFIDKAALARRALLAQRQRFLGSPRAAEAAFLLGRLEDETDEGTSRALTWYDRYLTEAIHGRYVSEALGRKMTALQRSGRGAEALAIASDYLARFPSGSYAHAASALLARAGSQSGTKPAPRAP